MKNVTLVGNLAADPKFFEAKDGKKEYALMTIFLDQPWDYEAKAPVDREEPITVKVFGASAQHAAESLTKGNSIIVVGRLSGFSTEAIIGDADERKITLFQVNATNIGPDLRWQTVEVTKAKKSGKKYVEDAEDVAESESSKSKTSTSRTKSSASKTKQSASKVKAAASAGDDDW